MNIEELIKDESFSSRVKNAKNLGEIALLFRERGVEVTADELQKAMDVATNEELSEDRLEDVAGGFGAVGALTFAGVVAVGRWLYNTLKNKGHGRHG